MRPRVLRRSLALAGFGAILAATGTLWGAGTARADQATDYGDTNWPAVCTTLDAYPSVAGVMGVGQAIVNEGYLSFYDAGKAIAWSVYQYCPRHTGLLERFVAASQPGFAA